MRSKTLTFVAFGILFMQFNLFAAVVANVGTKAISTEDVRSEFSQIPAEQKKMINKDILAKQNLVDSAINAEVLYQSALKANMDKDAEYAKALEKFKKQYLASKFLEKSVEPKLASGELKNYYNSNKKLFDESQVCAFHIVVQTEQEAAALTKEAQKSGTDFAELAKKHSMDPTVQDNGGDLGCFTRERMVKAFSDVAFGMKKGEIKGPVTSSYGYHVIKLYDTKAGKTPNFEEIAQRVKETYRLKVTQDLLSGLREKNKVKVDKEELKKFTL